MAPKVTQQQVVEYIKAISVLELSQLVKTLESELGVSAAAADGDGDADGRRVRRHPVAGGTASGFDRAIRPARIATVTNSRRCRPGRIWLGSSA